MKNILSSFQIVFWMFCVFSILSQPSGATLQGSQQVDASKAHFPHSTGQRVQDDFVLSARDFPSKLKSTRDSDSLAQVFYDSRFVERTSDFLDLLKSSQLRTDIVILMPYSKRLIKGRPF